MKDKVHLFPRNMTLKKIKEWMFFDVSTAAPELKKTFVKQSTVSLFLLVTTMAMVSLFIFVISMASNLEIFQLLKSQIVLIIYFLGVIIIHKSANNRKTDYFLLLFSLFFVATWGVAKDIINFDIVFNRYGILYISIIFIGMIFMPFPAITPFILGVYCAFLYGILWFLFIYQIFGNGWIIALSEYLDYRYFREHLQYIISGKYFFPHWRYQGAWYFFRYIFLGAIVMVFRAANIQVYVKAFITSRKLTDTEAKLKATRSLLDKMESQHIEFKSSARWDYFSNKVNKELEKTIIKTIAGFMNSEGGTLLLGVQDDGKPIGLQQDYITLKKKNSDGYGAFLVNLVSTYLGKEYCSNLDISFLEIDNKEICTVEIRANDKPVFVEQMEQALFVRTGNSTQKLNTKEALKYVDMHFIRE